MKNTQSNTFFEDNAYSLKPNAGLILVGWDLHTPGNMGALIRLGGNFNSEKVLLVNDVEPKSRKIKHTAATAHDSVDWKFIREKNWRDHIPDDYKLVAIETAEGSENLFHAKFDDKVAFIVGSERFGIPNEILEICDACVHIPVFGHVKSFNVNNSLSMVLYEWAKQMVKT